VDAGLAGLDLVEVAVVVHDIGRRDAAEQVVAVLRHDRPHLAEPDGETLGRRRVGLGEPEPEVAAVGDEGVAVGSLEVALDEAAQLDIPHRVRDDHLEAGPSVGRFPLILPELSRTRCY